MSIGSLYTLAEAKDITGEQRHLITFLINDRRIPTRLVGMAKVLDEQGLEQLKAAIAEYRAKADASAVVA